ncbi:MAG TPA: hypothetical protein VG755_11340 [Nannocystaceae bacterium]|nr:hypothetical protein [Nannocystaceae bacterium]
MHPIERWDDGKPPLDEAEDFTRRRRWFHAHAIALGTSVVLEGVGMFAQDQRIAALGGLALAFAAIAALLCGRTLVTFFHRWRADGRDWHEDRSLRGEALASVIALLVLGVAIAVLGALGRIDEALSMGLR